jgi:hypothetical protein
LRVGLNAEQSLDTSKAGLHSTLSSLWSSMPKYL